MFASVPERWSCFKTADATATSSLSSSLSLNLKGKKDFLAERVDQLFDCHVYHRGGDGRNLDYSHWPKADWGLGCIVYYGGWSSYDSKLGKGLSLFLQTYTRW